MSDCPTPDKSSYTSENAAKRALRSITHPQGRMRPYRCGSHWHLGHGNRLDHDHTPRRKGKTTR